MSKNQFEDIDPDLEEKKRKKEILIIVGISLLFLFLTWVEFKLFGISERLPLLHSVFFFGLVNFNIILFLILSYFIFRNIAKIFTNKEKGFTNKSLKAKLITAFVGFSFVPTGLMFLVSVFYINNSVEKWFNPKIVGVLKSSLETTNAYFISTKKKNYHFAGLVANKVSGLSSKSQINSVLKDELERYQLGSVEYYDGLWGRRFKAQSEEISYIEIPSVNLEFRKKGVRARTEQSTIFQFGEGNLIRVIVPASVLGKRGAVVVSSFIPMSLIEKTADIATAYENFRDIDPIAYPLKSIYLIILVLMTLTILLFATWFGFYLARQLSIPLVRLSDAANSLAKGEYKNVEVKSSSPEVSQLVDNFNVMSRELEASQSKITNANRELRETLSQLDEGKRYLQVILANVKTGVVSLNEEGIIKTINNKAAELLGIEAENYLGLPMSEVLNKERSVILDKMSRNLRRTGRSHANAELQVPVDGNVVNLQLTLSLLTDEGGKEVGRILVFNDLTPLVRAQRTAAWREVAKRIAHEIKNPLTPIRLSAQRLKKKFGHQITDVAFSDCTATIIEQVDTIKELVNEFSLYARMPTPDLKLSQLRNTVDEVLRGYQGHHKGVNFEVDFFSDIPEFYYDHMQLKRVFTNLVDNAIAARSEEKELTIKIVAQLVAVGNMVRVSVIDNGRGVTSGILSHIFDPYVTSKKEGTGLGLAIVKKTIEDHEGIISARRVEPSGLEISMDLPLLRKLEVKEG